MEVSSIQKLCQRLISCAIQRCRMSDDICRLSVVLKSSLLSNPPVVQISISDTGVGSSLDEFQKVKCMRNSILENWDGMVSFATTGICDNEIYQYDFNLKENASTRRQTKLPSKPKNGAKFSGTEVLLSTRECIDGLLPEITCFLRKVLILNIPKVAIELVVHWEDTNGSRCENIISANECTPLTYPASSIECLKSGFQDYVMKHGNSLHDICHLCFFKEKCLAGTGVACSSESLRSASQVMEAVIIFSRLRASTPCCFRACGSKTEVLYFRDFSPCSISQSSLNSLTSIDWNSYGLTLRRSAEQDGNVMLEWENMPLYSYVDIILHCYHKQVMMPMAKQKTKLDRTLTTKAVKLALNDLKENNTGVLLSAHALKISSHAPDLARTIAGLILCSNDSDFQGECFSLLGLSHEEERGIVENRINEKIVSVIEMNDRRPQRGREGAPYLFKDDCSQDLDFMDEECNEGEEAFGSMDL